MNYVDEDTAFERWCENNYLPIQSQAIWKKLFKRFNRSGWSEWVTVDNLTLMAEVQIKHEKTFIAYRDKLICAGLIEYIKGKKGSPNKYKLITFEKYTSFNAVHSTVDSTVYTPVYRAVNSTDINKQNINKTYNNVDDRAREGAAKNPLTYYEQHFGLLRQTVIDEIRSFSENGIEDALICKAIDVAFDQNVKKWSYARKILDSCVMEGTVTLADYLEKERLFQLGKGAKASDAQPQKPKKTRFSNFEERENIDFSELQRLEAERIDGETGRGVS